MLILVIKNRKDLSYTHLHSFSAVKTRLETDAKNAWTQLGSIVRPAFSAWHKFSIATSLSLWNASLASLFTGSCFSTPVSEFSTKLNIHHITQM